jgi:hypothetical protein
MECPMDLIVNVPYGPYTKESTVITAENFESLLTEAVPEKAFKEFEEIRKTKWKHVNIKFCFQDLEIEYAVDLEKKIIVTVYFSRKSTGEILSCSRTPVEFSLEKDLKAETSARFAEADIL